MDDWHRNSWREKAIQQDVEYSDPAALEDAKAKLASLPPLVSHIEVDRLRSQLADGGHGKSANPDLSCHEQALPFAGR